MPKQYKVLAQYFPADTVGATIYTVPAGRAAIISSITVANIASNQAGVQVDIYLVKAGEARANKHRLVYGLNYIAYHDTLILTGAFCLSAGDSIFARSWLASAACFNVFGSEVY